MIFDWGQLTDHEYEIAMSLLDKEREPDLTIAPDGNPYLFRWHLYRSPLTSSYFHIQVADDPERPLHDHPWDNCSNILSGGYIEILHAFAGPPERLRTIHFTRRPGQTIFRKAEWSHRLQLGLGVERTLTTFSCGLKRRPWGFWYPDGWRPYEEVTRLSEDGKTSVHIGRQHVPA